VTSWPEIYDAARAPRSSSGFEQVTLDFHDGESES